MSEPTAQHQKPISSPGGLFLRYADTAPLDDAELRAIARDGVPVDQVLACWRLMTRGQALLTTDAPGPDPGIRRLLLLNLAIGQELGILAVIARHDPEPAIRKEAVAWLWRVAPAAGRECLREVLPRESDVGVVLELLHDLPDVPWQALTAELEQLLEHHAAPVRHRVADLLIDSDGGVRPALRCRLRHEADYPMWIALTARWAASRDHAALLDELVIAPGARADIVHALRKAGCRYPFEQLSRLVDKVDDAIVTTLMGPPYSAAARAWLLARVREGLDAIDRLTDAYSGCTPEDTLSREDVARVQLLGAEARVAWSDLRAELESLLDAPFFAFLAAERLLDLVDGISASIRQLALESAHPGLLARWAASDAHCDLLTAALAIEPHDTVTLGLT